MAYIDCVLAPVKTANKAEYLKFAQEIDAAFIAHGALEVVDCWGIDVEDGELTSMPKAVDLKDDETVGFAWIWWPSREVRDAAYAAIFTEDGPFNEFPFDGRRMIFGGFEPMVDLKTNEGSR